MISAPLVAYFVLALGVSFACSLFEATLLSTTDSHVAVLRSQGKASGRILAKLKERIDRPIVAILTLNTVANMFGAAGVGAEAGRLAREAGRPEAVVVGVASGVLTLSILVLSEIVPKTLGAVYWKGLAPVVAPPLNVLVIVLRPVVLLLESIPKMISSRGQRAFVTREEVGVMADMAHRAGALGPTELRIVANLLGMRDLRAHDAMTPRLEVFALEKDLTAEEVLEKHPKIRFTRIPVYDGSIDRVAGLVLRSRLNEACLRGRADAPLGDLMQPIHAVPDTASLVRLLETFIERREHLFLVVNEHGGVEGIITLEDVIESLIGQEIVDELDLVADLRKLAERKGEVRKRRMRVTE